MLSVVALSSSALIVGLRPAVRPVTVLATETLSQDMTPTQTLADQYRNRWAGDDGVVRPRTHTVRDASADAFSSTALPDVVCIVADDGEEVCGPASFDSVEGGVVCVETEDGEQVCAIDA